MITGRDKARKSFDGYVNTRMENAINAAIAILDYVGLRCVEEARRNGSYTDRTGNLRSSVGYAVLRDGKVVSISLFEKVKGQGENYKLVKFKTKTGKDVKYWAKGESGDGSKGSETGKALVSKLASRFNTGLVLIVVAGMEYASYVESLGYNVLNSAEDLAKKLVPEMINKLGK